MGIEAWILYRTESAGDQGWEQRKLLPGGGLTDLLSESWSSSGRMPHIGERVREYENLNDPGNGVTHGKDGDWVVTRVVTYTSPDSEERIIVCYCQYQPIDASWQLLKRGKPVEEMLAAVEA